jgi:drug/metabolite transporter (DMT)-like permease
MEWAWLGTTLTLSEIGCGLLVLIGVAVALAPGRNAGPASKHVSSGILFGILAAVCQALGAVLSRKAFAIAQRAGENIDGITAAYQRILGGVLVTAVFLWIVKRREPAAGNVGERWRQASPWVLLNGLSGPALGVSCYQWALKAAPTGIVLPIVAVTPIVIIPFSRYIEGERPTWRSLTGGLVAVIGAVLLAVVRA